MKFYIETTSVWHDQKPHPQAEKDIVQNGIQLWSIQFDTFERFVQWVGKQSCAVIISHHETPGAIPLLEIYDDYRE